MTILLFIALMLGAAIFCGLDAAWQTLDPLRLRHRADKGNSRATQMLAWRAVRPQADLVLVWTSRLMAAGALVILSAEITTWADGKFWWVAPMIFLPTYALFVQVMPRQIFRRLPFVALARLWWLMTLAGSFWAPFARPVAALLRFVREDTTPKVPVAEEIMALASQCEDVSLLERTMLRSVLDFRRLTALDLAIPLENFPQVQADVPLKEVLAERKAGTARHTLVMGADGSPLGVMSCGSAALSGSMEIRAQSFARAMLTFSAGLPAWRVLTDLRRASTPVADVRDEKTGYVIGVVTEQSVIARLLGEPV